MQLLPWGGESFSYSCGFLHVWATESFLPKKHCFKHRLIHSASVTGGGPEAWSWPVLPEAFVRDKVGRLSFAPRASAWHGRRPFLWHWAMLVTQAA